MVTFASQVRAKPFEKLQPTDGMNDRYDSIDMPIKPPALAHATGHKPAKAKKMQKLVILVHSKTSKGEEQIAVSRVAKEFLPSFLQASAGVKTHVDIQHIHEDGTSTCTTHNVETLPEVISSLQNSGGQFVKISIHIDEQGKPHPLIEATANPKVFLQPLHFLEAMSNTESCSSQESPKKTSIGLSALIGKLALAIFSTLAVIPLVMDFEKVVKLWQDVREGFASRFTCKDLMPCTKVSV